jgi:iron(II)-dependent oxidoreductase
LRSTSSRCQDEIKTALEACRAGTLAIFEGMDTATFVRQVHPDFSPVGWHLGHIGYTEALWLLQHCAKLPPLFPQYHKLFTADGLPKSQRGQLPSLSEILEFLKTIRHQVLAYLEVAPVETQERLWRFILQHESQHCETILFVLAMLRGQFYQPASIVTDSVPMDLDRMIKIPAGSFIQGSNGAEALDNERPAFSCYLETYWIDQYPVTCGQYRQFMEAGGYENPQWWLPAGWKWLQANPVKQPLYWIDDPAFDLYPVCGVSWYEADAYARFAGKRLPTEAEWEKAASWNAQTQEKYPYPWGDALPDESRCNQSGMNQGTTPVCAYPAGISPAGCYDMLGNVWEWTNTWFDGYDGFEWFPYKGYSQTYFDGEHRVLKGGSWATRRWAMRGSFRNWYHPHIRQILAGFRCACSIL